MTFENLRLVIPSTQSKQPSSTPNGLYAFGKSFKMCFKKMRIKKARTRTIEQLQKHPTGPWEQLHFLASGNKSTGCKAFLYKNRVIKSMPLSGYTQEQKKVFLERQFAIKQQIDAKKGPFADQIDLYNLTDESTNQTSIAQEMPYCGRPISEFIDTMHSDVNKCKLLILLTQINNQLQRLHDIRITHNDLHMGNIAYLESTDTFSLIDLTEATLEVKIYPKPVTFMMNLIIKL